jgi:dTDP-4-dehydrorhamnose reductase
MGMIWITGSKGQLGTELFLQHKKLPEHRFLFTDIEELDLCNERAVINFVKTEKPNIIVNCAAYTAVDKAETDRDNAFLINCEVPEILTGAADQINASLIHISTDYVFNGCGSVPYREDEDPDPRSVYGESKLCGEQEVIKGAGNIILRTSWMYSAYGNNFVKTMLRLGSERNEINVVADQYGSPTSAADLADVILTIIDKVLENNFIPGGIYHYSNQGVCTWYDFAVEIMEIAGLTCKVNPVSTREYPTPAKRPMYSVMDKGKIMEVFGLEIPDWKVSLRKVVDQLKK